MSYSEGVNKPLSRRIFDKYDNDGSGFIDKAEFSNMCRDQGIILSEKALALAMKDMDLNGDNKITYDEFLAWKKRSCFSNFDMSDQVIAQRLNVAQTFDKYDTNKDGSLSKNELIGFHSELKNLGLVDCDLNGFILHLDSNCSGEIEFHELVSWFESMVA